MGKLNKKLIQSKPSPKPDKKDADSKAVSGPFPIYRTIPVQLNGPEPKSFKVSSKSKKTKITAKPIPAPENVQPEPANNEPKDAGKVKKLRKTTISRLNKKEKIKFRKDEMLKKVELTQKAFKEDKLKKKREKTAVTGDMRPLLDALPSLDSLFKMKSADTIKTGVPKYDKKAIPKTKQQLKVERLKKKKVDFLARCQKVNQVLKSKKFKKNPKKMIAEHIRNTRKEQLQLLMGGS
ncbi:AAEL010970-PA [Aedes aegypti]|uniref:AAEL010970-PA n=3 Tax=Aedes aegypti TaxID=7159 RepID=A0A1S4FRY8_AEDAE|nr:protein FAM207A isoform X1 [Aedes aegypti]EAT36988.1 AAEL010970-PA [Aedes aegypti]